jgi:hypothetical protein
MSKEVALQFLRAVEQSPYLQHRIAPLDGKDTPDNIKKVLDIAAQAGYIVSFADLRSAMQSRAENQIVVGELSEEDLEKVAGGYCVVLTLVCIMRSRFPL